MAFTGGGLSGDSGSRDQVSTTRSHSILCLPDRGAGMPSAPRAPSSTCANSCSARACPRGPSMSGADRMTAPRPLAMPITDPPLPTRYVPSSVNRPE